MNRQDELIQHLMIKFEDPSMKVKSKEALASLMESWKMGLNMSQAAARIGVNHCVLSYWLSEIPELNELKEMCCQETNRMARENIHRAIKKGSIETSKWFLERTDPEFAKKDNMSAPVQVNIISVADRENELKKFMERFTDAGVIDTVITEERDVSTVGEGEDTVALQKDQLLTY